MSQPISIYAAKTRLSELIAKAEAGAEVIIARGKKPVAKLVPLSHSNIVEDSESRKMFPGTKRYREPGRLEGKLNVSDEDLFAPLPAEELELWVK